MIHILNQKFKKNNKGEKDKELNSNKSIDISVLFNLAQLSQPLKRNNICK